MRVWAHYKSFNLQNSIKNKSTQYGLVLKSTVNKSRFWHIHVLTALVELSMPEYINWITEYWWRTTIHMFGSEITISKYDSWSDLTCKSNCVIASENVFLSHKIYRRWHWFDVFTNNYLICGFRCALDWLWRFDPKKIKTRLHLQSPRTKAGPTSNNINGMY